jgi:hypothetical protein
MHKVYHARYTEDVGARDSAFLQAAGAAAARTLVYFSKDLDHVRIACSDDQVSLRNCAENVMTSVVAELG